jgi:hypothetical protein
MACAGEIWYVFTLGRALCSLLRMSDDRKRIYLELTINSYFDARSPSYVFLTFSSFIVDPEACNLEMHRDSGRLSRILCIPRRSSCTSTLLSSPSRGQNQTHCYMTGHRCCLQLLITTRAASNLSTSRSRRCRRFRDSSSSFAMLCS